MTNFDYIYMDFIAMFMALFKNLKMVISPNIYPKYVIAYLHFSHWILVHWWNEINAFVSVLHITWIGI